MPRTFQYYPQAGRLRWLQQAELNDLQTNLSARNSGLLQTAAPTITPNGGTFVSAPTVTLTAATPGSLIYYTLDGSVPTAASTLYTVPFVVGDTSVLRCIAVAPGFAPSQDVSAAFTISTPQVGTPIFSPSPGTYTSAQRITIAALNSTSIRYTLDGTEPSPVSPLYITGVDITATAALRAKGYASGFVDSDTASGVYTIGTATVIDPVPSPSSGTNFSGTIDIFATCATSGALIYYTVDGSAPTQASTLLSTPVPISLTTTFKFRAYKSGMTPSNVITATYTLDTVTMNGWYGSSAETYLQEIYWNTTYTTWTKTLEQMWTTPIVINYPTAPPATGGYRAYICQNTAPPIQSGTQGIFALTPADFAGVDEGYSQTDANGWPCYIPTTLQDGYPYRVYRLKYPAFGAFTLSIQHTDES